MKLHLPSGLRKALLACLAALAAHTLPLTLASGASLTGSAALVSFLLSQESYAAFDESEWEDAYTILWSGHEWGGSNQQNPNGYDDSQGWSSWLQGENNVAGNKVIFDVDPSLRFFTPANKPSLTVRADLWLRRDMTITNGSSGTTWTFEGSIVGAGNINWNWNNTFSFVFKGNMEEWTGNITNTTSNNFSMTFEGEDAVSGSGTITTNGALTINGATMNNASITAQTLTLSGSSTLNVDSFTVKGAASISADAEIRINQGEFTLNSGLSMAAGSSLLLRSGASLVHAGGTSDITAGTLTLERGATLSVVGGSLTLGGGLSLTVSDVEESSLARAVGSSASIVVSKGGHLTLDASLLTSLQTGDLIIDLSLNSTDFTRGNVLPVTLTGANDLTIEDILPFFVDNDLLEDWQFDLDDDGNLIVYTTQRAPEELVWNVDGDDNTWDKESNNWNWNNLSSSFVDRDSVTFDAVTEETITIAPEVVLVDNMTIIKGNWTFEGGGLDVAGAMVIGTLEGEDVATTAQVTFSSSTVKNLGNVTVNKGSELVLKNLDNISTTQISGGGSLVFHGVEATEAHLPGVLLGTAGTVNANSLGALALRAGAKLSVHTHEDARNAVQQCQSIVVENSSLLEIEAHNLLEGTGHTLSLSGFGGSYGYNAALRLYANSLNTNQTWNIGWDIEVDSAKGSAINALQNVNRLELNGNINATGTSLTVDAGRVMLYGSDDSATCTITAENGSVELKAGDWITFNGKLAGDNSTLTITSTSTSYNAGDRNVAIQGSFGGENATINFNSNARVELMNNAHLNFTGSGCINVNAKQFLLSKSVDGLRNYDIYLGESIQYMHIAQPLTVRSLQGGVDEKGNNIEGYNAKVQGSSSGSGSYSVTIDYSGTTAAVWAGTFWEPSADDKGNNNFNRWVHVTKAGTGTQRLTAAQSRLRGLTVEAGILDLAAGGTIGGGNSSEQNQFGTGTLTLHGGATLGLGGTLNLTNATVALANTSETSKALVSIDVTGFSGGTAVFTVSETALGGFGEGLQLQLSRHLTVGESLQLFSGVTLDEDKVASLLGLLDRSGLSTRLQYELSSAGVLSAALTSAEGLELTWDGGHDGTWFEGGSTGGWLDDEDDTFYSTADTAVFTADYAGDKKVSIADGVNAGTIKVKGGDWVWEQQGAFSTGALTVESGSLSITEAEADAEEAAVQSATTFGGAISLGTAEVATASLSVSTDNISLTGVTAITGTTLTDEDENVQKSSATFSGSSISLGSSAITIGGANQGVDVTFDGAITSGAGLNIAAGSSVTIKGAAGVTNNAGVITVNSGAELVLDGMNGWNLEGSGATGTASAQTPANKIVGSGGGTVVLKDWLPNTDQIAHLFWRYFDAAHGFNELVLRGDSQMEITGNYPQKLNNRLDKFNIVTIESGSTLRYTNSTKPFKATATFSIAGTGYNGNGALLLGNSSFTLTGTVSLAADATIKTTADITLSGTLTGNEHELTLDLGGAMTFGGGLNSASSGTIRKKNNGALIFSYTDGDALKNYDIVMEGGAVRIDAAKEYKIHSLSGAAGSVWQNGNTLGATLVLTLGEDEEATYSGQIGSRLGIKMSGAGKQVLAASGDDNYVGGTVTVEAGTLEFSGAATLIDVNANGGTLKLSNTGASVTGTLTVNGGTLDIADGVSSLGTLHLVNSSQNTEKTTGTLEFTQSVGFTNVKVDTGKTLLLSGTGKEWTVSAALVAANVAGTVAVDAGTLTLSAGGGMSGTLSLTNEAQLKLGGDLDVSGVVLDIADGSIVSSDGATMRYLAFSSGTVTDFSNTEFDEHVGVKVTGESVSLGAGNTINTKVVVDEGALLDMDGVTDSAITGKVEVNGTLKLHDGAALSTEKAISGAGTLQVQKSRLELAAGGSIHSVELDAGETVGDTELSLGGDLILTSLSGPGDTAAAARLRSTAEDGVTLVFAAPAESNTTEGGSTTTVSGSITAAGGYEKLVFDGVSIRVEERAELSLSSAGVLGADVDVEAGGALDLSGMTANAEGKMGISGTVTVNGGALTLADGVSLGTLHVVDTANYVVSGATYSNIQRVVDNVSLGTAVVDEGRTLRFQEKSNGAGGTWSISKALTAEQFAGNLDVWHGTLTLENGGALAGRLEVAWGGTLSLGADLHLGGGLSLTNNANSKSNFRSADGEEHDLIFTGEVTLSSAVSNSVFDGVNLRVQSGKLTSQGNIGTAVAVDGGAVFAAGTVTVSGAVTGAGTLQVSSGGTLTLGAAENEVGELSLLGDAVALEQGGALVVHRLSGGDAAVQLAAGASAASFTIHLSAEDEADHGNYGEGQFAVNGVAFEKKGAGTQRFSDFRATGVDVLVSEGALQADSAQFRVEDGELILAAAAGKTAAFHVNVNNWEAEELNISLRGNGSVKWVAPQDAPDRGRMGTLTVSGTGNALDLGKQPAHERSVSFAKLTSAGNDTPASLSVGELSGRGDTVYQTLSFETVENYHGTVYGATAASGSQSRVQISHVHQDAGYAAAFDITGVNGPGVYSSDFRKTGEGSLSITHLTMGPSAAGNTGMLRMDYEGTLSVGKVTVQGEVALVYTSGTADHLLSIGAEDLLGSLASGRTLLLDVSAVGDARLKAGICLGLTGELGLEDTAELKKLFSLDGIDDAKSAWSLSWVGEKEGSKALWLTVEQAVVDDSAWDPRWGAGAIAAPGWDEMPRIEDATGEELSVTALSAADGHGGKASLQAGSGGSRSLVLGGAAYAEGAAPAWTEGSTWILMQGGSHHILAGGSLCATPGDSAATAALGGHRGASHLELHGGTADYIVGGNHLNSSAVSFVGNSYISVFDGAVVRGGIVGGSTLSAGYAESDLYAAFQGDSAIFIYTALANASGLAAISQGYGEETGASMTAVVGGNAQLAVAAKGGQNTFLGAANITVDLSGTAAAEGSVFQKAIVGGNYVAALSGAADSAFVGSTRISITGREAKSGKDVRFTGGISGASRSAAAGRLSFTGSTSVEIEGGVYSEAIAGGFRLEGTGARQATLAGDTAVSIRSGNVWRVAGGSYSAGGSGAVQQSGSSSVSISGGSISGAHGGSGAAGQQALAFVAGGSFYRGVGGASHGTTGSTSVEITGGDFEDAHIVGGDYANFTGTADSATSIGGTSGVSISAAKVTGLVIGGSYLTDEGQGGHVSAGGTSVVLSHGATLSHEDGHAAHRGIAVVAGHVLIDEDVAGDGSGAGDHTATVQGDTLLRVEDGASITGHLVGGSYTNENEGRNTLSSTGRVSIELAGGSITGNVYGGHYSDNTAKPDALELGEVSILVEGNSTVDGNIVGGSRRKAAVAGGAQPAAHQESIRVQLVSGSVTGNVYAAGENAAAALGDSYKVSTVTEQTTVTVGSEFRFAEGAVVSGGYLRAEGVKDESTVARSVLELSSSEHLSGVTWRDFSEIHVAGEGEHIVLDAVEIGRGTQVAGSAGSLRKSGAGDLTLSKLTADGTAGFAGQIWVEGGSLSLEKKQSLNGGLGFTLGRVSNTAATAYLRGFGGFSHSASGLIQLGLEAADGELRRGRFYLASGLEGLLGSADLDEAKLGKIFNLGKGSAYAAFREAADAYELSLQLKEGVLMLTVRMATNSDEWYWEGDNAGEDMVWRGDSASNWNQTDPASTPNVNFDEAGMQGMVQLGGGITVGNLWVQGGSYSFAEIAGEYDAPVNGLVVKGKLIVGGDGPAASLDLDLATKSIAQVELREGGVLTLNHEGAIQAKTGIHFAGGTLVWGENGSDLGYHGKLDEKYATVAADTVLHVQVGKTYGEILSWGLAPLSARAAVPQEPVVATESMVTLGSATSTLGTARYDGEVVNNALKAALEVGVVKTGRHGLSIEWVAPASAEYSGSSEALCGTLEYRLHGKEGQTYSFSPEKNFVIAGGATLELALEGAGTLDISRPFESVTSAEAQSWFAFQEMEAEARAVIGSEKSTLKTGAVAPYTMSADNSAYTGAIQLRGGSSRELRDRVVVNDVRALGGSGSTLELAGRDIAFGAPVQAGESGYVEVAVKELRVLDGTASFIGGYYASTDANAAVALSAKHITGAGTIANAKGGFHHTLSGDYLGFSGTIVAGAAATTGEGASEWTLLGTPGVGELHANLAGTGTVKLSFDGQKELALLGSIGGDAVMGNSVSVENTTAGSKLILAGAGNTSTGALIFHSNEMQLGDKAHESHWAGATLTEAEPGSTASRFVLANGSLGAAMTAEGKGAVALAVAADGTVNVAGTEGALLDDILINRGGKLREVSGTITAGSAEEGGVRVRLVFDELNMSDGMDTGDNALIGMREGGVLEVKEGGVQLDFSGEGLMSVLKNHRTQDYITYLHLLSGGALKMETGVEDTLRVYSGSGYGQLLADLGFITLGCREGDLALAGSSADVYLVLNEWNGEADAKSRSHNVSSYDTLSAYKATALDAGTTLTLTLSKPEAMVVNNLIGLAGASLVLEKAKDVKGEVKVQLNNSRVAEKDFDRTGVDHLDAVPGDELLAQDTQFKGTIIGKAGVTVEKTGAGTLTVGDEESAQGGMRVQGSVSIADGGLRITGARESSIGSLIFTDTEAGEGDGVTITDGVCLTLGSLADAEGGMGSVSLERGAELVITGKGAASHTMITSPDGSGTLTFAKGAAQSFSGAESGVLGGGMKLEVQGGATLSLADGAGIRDCTVNLAEQGTISATGAGSGIHTKGDVALDGRLLMANGAQLVTEGALLQSKTGVFDLGNARGHSVGRFEGSGTLTGSGALTMHGKDNRFDGTLTGYGRERAGALVVAEGGALTLTGVRTDSEANLWDITMQEGSTLTVDVEKSALDVNFGSILLGDKAELVYTLSTEKNTRMHATIAVESTARATFTITANGMPVNSEQGLYIGNIAYDGAPDDLGKSLLFNLIGSTFLHFNGTPVIENGYLYIKLTEASNRFLNAKMGKNPRAGAELFWAATSPDSAAYAYAQENPEGDLASFTADLTAAVQSGARVDKALAAGAGSAVSTLGSAVSEDLRRQLDAIRNRSSLLTADLTAVRGHIGSHVWMNGETAYHKMDADGYAPGYTLNGWGGSAGVDVELNRNLNAGLAITAMYNDLKTAAADSATGDLDTAYLSAFARVATGAWTHTFVATVGTVEATLNRTVQSPLGYTYRTHGATDGYAYGAMYEVGFSYLMNKRGTFALQPVANVQLRHSSLSGYTESGSDAGLRVNDISQTVATFGIGARVQAMFSENAFNRSVIVEGRVLAKADAGDRSSTAVTRLLHSNDAAELESAELGAVGVELGAGLTVPLGRVAGSIFVDAAAEFRSGYTTMSASAGYRVSF